MGRWWPLALLDYDPADDAGTDVSRSIAIRDPKDLPVVLEAIGGRCEVLVTGDRDFDDVHVDALVAMTPREFVGAFGGC